MATRQATSFVQSLAQDYNRSQGLPAIVDGHYVPVDETLARDIARVYETLSNVDESARQAYEALAQEILQQWIAAVQAGISFEPWLKSGQPYANSVEMCTDVRENKHLWFFVGGDIHPTLGYFSGIMRDGNELSFNDLFRAVHDLFGHSAEGYQFGTRGEENAWLHHSMMFSPLAQLALTTETRGQNSWVNFGPYSHLPVCDRPFAQQKAALLPAHMCDWQTALAR